MSGLKARVADGAKWSMIARLVRTLVGIGTVAVLARFLTPAEFGLVALILFVTQVAQVFNDFGTRMALVQRKDVTELEMDSVFWTNIGLALVMTGLCLALATPLANLFDAPGMEAPLRWITPVFLIGAVRGVAGSVLQRRFAFGKLALVGMISGIAGALTAVVLVLAGARIGALIGQQLVIAGTMSALTIWFARWRPGLRFSWAALKPLISYGSYIAMSGMVHFATHHANRPIIAGGLSATALGYYTVTQQIVATPINMFVQTAQKVLFPVLSSIQTDSARLRRAHTHALHALMAVMAPACVGLAVVGEPMAAVLLGPGWEMVGTVVVFMALQGPFVVVTSLNSTIFAATGHARLQFWLNLLGSALILAVLLWSLRYGLVWVVAARLGVSFVLTPIKCFFAFRCIGQTASAVLQAIARPLLASGAMAGVVLALRSQLDMAALPTLVLCVAAGVVTYAAIALLIDRRQMLDLAQLGLRMRRQGA